VVGAALAAAPEDWIFPALRENAIMLVRGFALSSFIAQIYGTASDSAKGRQMPNHVSSRTVHQVSWSSCVGTQLPHAALRVFVMGQRGADREPATEADIAAMSALATRAVEAGALGFSTSRTLNHRTSDGQPTPTLTAGEDELTGIALGLAAADKGVLQVVSDFADVEAEFAMLRRIVEKSGRPLSFSLLQTHSKNGWRRQLAALERANAEGLRMKAQVCARPSRWQKVSRSCALR
jgi:N-acyl-D-aspartate/D-glutamate deacylase